MYSIDEEVESNAPTFGIAHPNDIINMESGMNQEHDFVDEEPAMEPEPEFDPEASISTRRYSRKKILLASAFIGVVAAVAVAIGVSYSKNNNSVIPSNANSKSSNNIDGEMSIKSIDDNSEETELDVLATVGTEEKVENEEEKVEEIVNISLDTHIKDYIDVTKGFMVDLQGFSEGVLSGYPTCSKLLSDVEEAAKYLANVIIQNKDSNQFQVMAAGGDYYSGGANVNSYETNNQVDGVDEADVVKSDGNNVYLAYGNELVVVSVDGEILSRTPMPQVDYSFPVIGYWSPDSVIQEADAEIVATAAFSARSSMKPQYYSPTQNIRSLLMHDDRLAVIVEGYQYSSSLIFLTGGMTAVLLYDVNEDGTLTLVDKKTIRGLYRDARSIDNQAHIVTTSSINSALFSSYLRAWMFPQGISDEEYKKRAYTIAKGLAPQFAKQLVAELLGSTHDGSVDDYSCSQIVRLSLMRNGVSSDETPDLTAGNGILNSYVQTTSFDMQSKFSLTESVSGAFLPSSWLNVYSSKDMLVMTAQGWKRTDDWKEYTYLMGFDVSNGVARPAAIGEIPGYLLNQYSLDHYNDHLRAATTLSASWGMVNGEWTRKTESQNQITVLQRSGNRLLPVGIVPNVAIGERIYSVRFNEDKAFVVTFKQIDPFFTFDLSDPTKPVQVGELKIRGFSNYLHPTNDENFILAVGQDANETTGMPMGLQISLFDTTDFANPKLAQKKVLQAGQNGFSASDAQYDPKAFRYLNDVNKLIIPVSKYSYNAEDATDFDGFRIYNIDEMEGITKVGEVIHADADLMSRACFSWAYIPSRSMVFKSNLLTMKGHTIMMTENVLDPGSTLWTIDLDEGRTATDVAGCMPWFT